MAQIEMLEPEWQPPEAQAIFKEMQAQIAEAFRLPDYIVRDAGAYARARQRAFEATEALRNEATKLYLEHCLPRVLVRNEE